MTFIVALHATFLLIGSSGASGCGNLEKRDYPVRFQLVRPYDAKRQELASLLGIDDTDAWYCPRPGTAVVFVKGARLAELFGNQWQVRCREGAGNRVGSADIQAKLITTKRSGRFSPIVRKYRVENDPKFLNALDKIPLCAPRAEESGGGLE
ncbi:MAG: hypothetical protein AAFP04_09815 [Myxococcota bacterium]